MDCVPAEGSSKCVFCGVELPTRIARRNCAKFLPLRAPEESAIETDKLFQQVQLSAESYGPGTELKVLLAGWPFYIVSTPTCKCNARARYMDEKGCEWCESPEGMAEIMGFLRESAEERGLPFLDLPARLLVRRAIANARKAEAARAREAERPPLHPEQ